MKLYRYSFMFLLIVGLFSCKKENPNDVSQNETDAMLEAALEQASNGQGRTFFTLPNSNDYSSIPQDPKNPLSADKVALGKLLFHETALATNPKHSIGKSTYSCASCHHAQGGFQACLPQGIGDGGTGFGETGLDRVIHEEYSMDEIDVQPLRTPSAMNSAFQKVTLWNGQFGATGMNEDTKDRWNTTTPVANNFYGYEGVETQAIAGLAVHRMEVDADALIEAMPIYKDLFDAAFPDFPESTRISRITTGLAIAAYERTLLANKSPFQEWLKGDNDAMSALEKEGAILFFDKAQCGSCHTGPALNSMEFYALGMENLQGQGVTEYDPTDAAHKGRGGFTGVDSDMYKFKVPQLYNLKDSPFYGHGSSFTDVESVIAYKNAGVKENSLVPDNYMSDEFQALDLTDDEVSKITAFIETALYDADLMRYVPETVPSGNCFPNNDPQSQSDLGCN